MPEWNIFDQERYAGRKIRERVNPQETQYCAYPECGLTVICNQHEHAGKAEYCWAHQ